MKSPPPSATRHASVRARLRWQLLASVSAMALIVSIGLHKKAKAEEPSPPLVADPGRWQIAFEGQLAIFGGAETVWDPGCGCDSSISTVGPDYGADLGISITREMASSGWLASFAMRYGRSNAAEDSFRYGYPSLYTGGRATHQEQHGIIDFAVGRDVGLGLFGRSGGTSTVTAGVRIAHFSADTDAALTAGGYYPSPPGYYAVSLPGQIKRSFTGIGPRIAWNGSAPIERNPAFSFDWGVAGALLFGRQKAQVSMTYAGYVLPLYARKESVLVPNVEGFAAVSWQPESIPGKLTVGYRIDAYFGVIDGGFDEADSVDRIIHGPFARFTVGLD